MLDSLAVREAFRERIEALSVADTGTASISVTSTNYVRAVGSFLDDGFAAGMEISASGFTKSANNGTKVVSTVTATTMAAPGLSAEAAGDRTITSGLPALRIWEGTQVTIPTGTSKRPYIIEQRQPATDRLVTFPAEGGETLETGFYILTWFALNNIGIAALERGITALRALFRPGTVIAVGDNAVRIDIGPQVGQFIPTDTGYLSCQVSIHWQGMSVNAVAA